MVKNVGPQGRNHKPVAVALVGCGAVSQLYYLPALRELSKWGIVSVEALFDPDSLQANKMNAAFPSAKVVGQLSDLADSEIELAIVASPNYYHASQSVELLQKGISVLCEKPMAISFKDAEEMVHQAHKWKRILAVGLFRRFFPALNLVHTLIKDGTLGKAKSFQFNEGGRFVWDLKSGSLFNPGIAGGGVLMDIGAHAVDLMTWWFGEPQKLNYEDDAMGGIEANCRLSATFDSGLTGSIHLSREQQLSNRYEIVFEKGSMSWIVGEANRIELNFAGSNFALNASIHDLETSYGKNLLGRLSDSYHQSFTAQLLNVFAAVRGAEQPVVSGVEALRSIKLIEQCYKNRKLMPMPWLTEAELKTANELKERAIC